MGRASRAVAALLLLALPTFSAGCTKGACKHGSWGPKHGWQCHDDNDERGPQRDIPPKQ